MKIKLIRHRIVTDEFLGYEVQVWRIWFPFWVMKGFCNTFSSIEKAEEYANNGRLVKLVKYL